MSMENAILEHAAALRELSAAIKMMYAGRGDALALPASQGGTVKEALATIAAAEPEQILAAVGSKDAEIEHAVQKVEDEAKAERKEAEDNQAGPTGADDITPLDYAKDVRPVLLAAIKKSGKDTVAAMLQTFGVDKADKLTADQLPAALAAAQKLAA